jgi:hypothetical protein
MSVAHLFSFLYCPIMSLRSEFRVVMAILCIKTMFGSSLPPVVCRRAHVLFRLFVFVCIQWCPTYIVLCFCFISLCLVYPICCQFLWIVHLWLPLRYSLTVIYQDNMKKSISFVNGTHSYKYLYSTMYNINWKKLCKAFFKFENSV